jgi:hypothetical protein
MMNALVAVLSILVLVLLVDNVLDRIMSPARYCDPYDEIVPADPFVPDDIQ